jgi:hypothetical protein
MATRRRHPGVSRFYGARTAMDFGPSFWLRADLGVTQVAGAKVSNWADLARKVASADVVQATDAQRFVWIADAGNGKPGIGNPAASNATMTNAANIISAQPNTIVCVYRAPAAITRTNVFFDGIVGRQSWQTQSATGMLDYAGTVRTTAVSTIVNRTIVHTSLFNGASSAFRINGAQYDTGDTGAGVLSAGIRIGNAAGSFAVEGYMQEIIVIPRLLAAGGELTTLEKMLSAFWGVGF